MSEDFKHAVFNRYFCKAVDYYNSNQLDSELNNLIYKCAYNLLNSDEFEALTKKYKPKDKVKKYRCLIEESKIGTYHISEDYYKTVEECQSELFQDKAIRLLTEVPELMQEVEE